MTSDFNMRLTNTRALSFDTLKITTFTEFSFFNLQKSVVIIECFSYSPFHNQYILVPLLHLAGSSFP